MSAILSDVFKGQFTIITHNYKYVITESRKFLTCLHSTLKTETIRLNLLIMYKLLFKMV